ncbi:MAG: hypothetical protein KDD52_02770 [Bdellovibrionales bacterium]|nr:hypothetical protein [Bdellovibrionales bacterium]
MNPHFHIRMIRSYIPDHQAQQIKEKFEDAGFLTSLSTQISTGGLESTYLLLSDGLLELSSVKNENLWSEQYGNHAPFRKSPRPFMVGFGSDGLEDENASQSGQGLELPRSPKAAYTYKTQSDQTPGVEAWVFHYDPETLENETSKLRMGDNSIFSVGGLLFCIAEPAQAQEKWKTWLSEKGLICVEKDRNLLIDKQCLEFVDANQYEELFKTPWKTISHTSGHLGAIVFYAKDLDRSFHYLSNAGFSIATRNKKRLWIKPDKSTGIAMIIEKMHPKDY